MRWVLVAVVAVWLLPIGSLGRSGVGFGYSDVDPSVAIAIQLSRIRWSDRSGLLR